MLINQYDCRDAAAGFTYTPWNFACWDGKQLPTSLFADIGPAVNNTCDPACQCYDFPLAGTVRTTFNRTNPCDWQSGVIVWVCSAFDYPLTLFVNTYQKIFQENASIPVISTVFSFSGDPTPNGSCSYNQATGETTGQISGTALIPSQGCSCGGCLVSYTVYFGTPP